ncbi:MAG TPA: mannonate dehydratase [Chitinophagaceae bacterium]|nr:mannonate dehydratase [Chitinophagaceae bacterium]
MKENRRNFLKKASTIAAATAVTGGGALLANAPRETELSQERMYAKDAGMQLSEAYFRGLEEKRIAFTKQLDVLGAVTGVRAHSNLKPWDPQAIKANKEAWQKVGLKWNVVEGPPALGDRTKLGLEGRDEEISNFITFMKNLKQHGGVDVICYNWMPVIGWYRTDNAKPGRGGALMTAFDYEDVKDAAYTKYGEVSKEALWKNLEYFLKAVVPEAEKIGMKLAMHPDDPQVDNIKGIGRIMNTVENFDRMLKLYPSKYNGVTLCQGNFSLMGADIPKLVKKWGKDKIHFVHFRNVRGDKFKFEETFHDEGQIDMYAAMKSYYDIGFTGPIRPDHVPTMAGDTNDFPGYSNIGILFALGYMRGLMESIK